LTPCQIFSQEIFEFTEAWEIASPGDFCISALRARDIDRDGVYELVISTDDRINDEMHHYIGIIQDGEISTISDTLRYQSWGHTLAIMDFNNDGIDDVMIESHPFYILRILTGPSLELDWEMRMPFYDRIFSAVEWRNEEGNFEPLVISAFRDMRGEPEEGVWDWECGALWRGSPMLGEPQFITYVPFVNNILVIDTSNQQRQDYFIAGFNYLLFEQDGGDEWDSLYYKVSTSYGSDFNNPDTTLLYCTGSFDPNGMRPFNEMKPAKYLKVLDFNNNGSLEFVMPWWDESDPDSLTVYIDIYDIDNYELMTRYTERLPKINDGGHIEQTVHYVKGVAQVDIDNDDVYELLLMIRDEPVRILGWDEQGNLELIGHSSLPYLDTNKSDFFVGRFDSRCENLQLAMHERFRIVVYNLPEEWEAPNDIPLYNKSSKPERFQLFSAYPNPFNTTTTITFHIPQPGAIDLTVFDPLGRCVRDLTPARWLPTGQQRVLFKAGNLAGGKYMLRLEFGGKVHAGTITLVK